jgi:hypothetical protein
MTETIEYVNGVKVINIITGDDELASNEVKQQRIDVCNSCEHKVNDGCKECSCLLVVRTAYKESFCPIGKW